MSINKVILTGRLGKDIDLRYTPNGKAVANFSLAVTDSYDREKTHWVSVTVWGKSAESCANYLSKGSLVGVDGRINTRDYENKEGRKVYVTEVIADRVEFIDSKGNGAPKTQDDEWNDLGKEINLKDVEISGDDSELPF